MFFGGDPFEHFAHAGAGGPGGGRPRRDVDTSKLYQTLGVSILRQRMILLNSIT